MKADIDKKHHRGPELETDMKITMWIIAASITLFIVALFAGYLSDLPKFR